MNMKENLKEIRELLIVIDMVNGFINEGALADPSVGVIIPEQIKIIEDFIKRKQGIMFVKDTHTKDSIEFKTFPSHCLKDTSEAELVKELKVYEPYGISIEKNSTSAIFAEGFITLMEQMANLEKVIGVGVESDICVPNLLIPLKNYFNQYNRDVEIIVPENAIATFDSKDHPREVYENASKLLMSQSGIRLVKKYERKEER